MMRKTTLDYAIRSALFLLIQISHCAQQQTRVLRMDAVRMKKMMLVFAILNAKNTTSELPTFVGDIAAIFVDQITLTWAYTATGGFQHIAATNQGMIEVLVPSLTNPGWTNGVGCNGFGVNNQGECACIDIAGIVPIDLECN